MAEQRKPSFEDYCAEHGITPEEKPAALAAYLHLLSEGTWDGQLQELSLPDEDE